MKKIYSYLTLAVAAIVLAACQQNEVEAPKTTPLLDIVSSELMLPASGGTGTIVVASDEEVKAASNKAWATVSVEDNVVSVSAGANEDYETRYAVLTLKSAGAEAELVLTQRGYQSFEFAPEDLVFRSKASSARIAYPFYSEYDIEAKVSQDWVSVKTVNEAGSKYLEVSVTANTRMSVRTAKVDWSVGISSGSFNVSQNLALQNNPSWGIDYVNKTEDNPDGGYFLVTGVSGRYSYAYMTVRQFERTYTSNTSLYADAVEAYEGFVNDAAASQKVAGKQPYTSAGQIPETVANGTYVVVVFGVDADFNPSGYYAVNASVAVTNAVVDNRTPYEKWLGTWEVKLADGTVDEWTVTEKVKNVSYNVEGIELLEDFFTDGHTVAVTATFQSATGAMQIAAQGGIQDVNMEDGTWKLGLYGMIEYSGNVTIVTGNGYPMVIASLGDNDTATLAGQSVTISGGTAYDIVGMRFGCIQDGANSYYRCSDADAYTYFPQTITQTSRVDGSGDGGGTGGADADYQAWLGSWDVTCTELQFDSSGSYTGEAEVTQTWTFTAKDEGVSFNLSGIEDDEYGVVEVIYDASTGGIMISPQLLLETTYSGNPDLYYLCAMYEDSSYLTYDSSVIICYGTNSGTSATLSPGDVDGTPVDAMRVLNSYGGQWYSCAYYTNLPATLTKSGSSAPAKLHQGRTVFGQSEAVRPGSRGGVYSEKYVVKLPFAIGQK